MKHLKKFNESYIHKEEGFDNIFYQRDDQGRSIELKDGINELNKRNNNFSPFIIKDLFIDFFDEELITNMEINKIYKKVKGEKIIKGKKTYSDYIFYTIEVYFKLSNEYSKKYYKLREDYLKEREEIRSILYHHYGHKSLNTDLSKFNLFDTVDVGREIFFNRNKDKIDFWSKALWL
jgi:hypothetical protein